MLRKPSEIMIDGKSLEEILNECKSSLLLTGVNLKGADLRESDLKNVDLRRTNLSGADLRGANLRDSDLSEADLSGADLSVANLSNADFKGAILTGTDLSYANLSDADLSGADLSGADLRGANLRDSDLSEADLSKVKYNYNTAFLSLQCPEEGSFVGYKKASNKIVKLLILEDSKRSSATSRKCRCDKAKVLSIESTDGKEKFTEAKSDFDCNFIYKVGEIVKVDNFCEDRWKECAAGIHFFITKQEAINY